MSDVLHKRNELPTDDWYACDHPERNLRDGRVHFRPGCGGCWVAFKAYHALVGTVFHRLEGGDCAVYDWDEAEQWWFGSANILFALDRETERAP